mgnify:CR=1 FL=1
MADKLLNSGDVFTNPVGDNVVVIDPNKVLVNGEVKDIDKELQKMGPKAVARAKELQGL